ncbi:MAG: glycerophosphodiester phosphodiesterase [Ilumatobacter sp.]
MQQRLPSRLDPPIGFAHRGARAHAPENTFEAFSLALRLGATGLESDVWVTADGVAVLDHDGVVRRGLRRTPFAEVPRAELPDHVPGLGQLLDEYGLEYELSLDVQTRDTYASIARELDARPHLDRSRVWLCDPDLDRLIEHREMVADVRLVHSTRLSRLPTSPELHAAKLSTLGVDAMNMHHTDWNGGLVVMFHRFDRLVFAWDLQFEYALENLIRMGADAVYSDHVDVMVDVLAGETGVV